MGIWFEVTLAKRLRSGLDRFGDEASPALVMPYLFRMPMKRFTSVLVKPTRARSEAQAAACAGSAQLFPAVGQVGLVHAVDVRILVGERFVLVVAEEPAVESVGAALGDGVHQAACKVALPHVERCHLHHELLHGFQRERLGSGLTAGRAVVGESEEVVVGAAVDLDVVETVVLAGDREALALTGHARISQHQAGEVAPLQRQGEDLGALLDAGGAGAALVGVGVEVGDHRDLLDELGAHEDVERQPLAERERDVLHHAGLETLGGGGEDVGAAGRDVVDEVRARLGADRVQGVAGGGVPQLDRSAFDRPSLVLGDGAGQGRAGDALRQRRPGRGHSPKDDELRHGRTKVAVHLVISPIRACAAWTLPDRGQSTR